MYLPSQIVSSPTCMFHHFLSFMAYDSSATDYDSVLELAQSNSSCATIDSDALQYFAARKSLRARPSRKH